MVNNTDYLHYQTVQKHIMLNLTYTQFHVQKLPEHGNYYLQCVCTHGTDKSLVPKAEVGESIFMINKNTNKLYKPKTCMWMDLL